MKKSNLRVSGSGCQIRGNVLKYVRIRVFTDLYSPEFCPYTGEYVSEETCILAYFMQCDFDNQLSYSKSQQKFGEIVYSFFPSLDTNHEDSSINN